MTEKSDEVRKGRCNCGAVRFQTRGPLRDVIYCHCRECRRQTGHFMAATSVPSSALDIEGGDEVGWYAASPVAERGFCKVCGATLFWRRFGGEATSIAAGSLDMPNGLKAQSHIFLSEKGDYYDIDDGLPRHDRW